MAIAKMRKLHLIAMSYEKDAILNALQRTVACEVVLHTDTENTTVPDFSVDKEKEYYSAVENALHALSAEVDAYEKEKKAVSNITRDGFDVSYEEFITANENRNKIDKTVAEIVELFDEKKRLQAQLTATKKSIKDAETYAELTHPFSHWKNTARVDVRLGTIPSQNLPSLEKLFQENTLADYEILSKKNDFVLLVVYAHKSVSSEMDGMLPGAGFSPQPYGDIAQSGQEVYNRLCEEEKTLMLALQENAENIYALRFEIRALKVYLEYLAFVIEKEETSEKLRVTQSTFLLEAFVPADEEDKVKQEIESSSSVSYVVFSEPTGEDSPPTLLKNNAVVGAFEGVTNTYSVPNYREFDPNAVMGFFYSLFMGFIIGDAGYGLLMAFVGGWIWWKNRKRPSGFSRLAGAFAFGGIFAVIWGLLFNSLFGFAVLDKTVMPNPQSDMWSILGISVPSVLIISMFIGLTQMFVGYLCRAVQEWRRGNVVDGLCDGVIWAVFTVGVAVALLGLTEQFKLPSFAMLGAYVAGGSLLLAVLTAGRKEKFFGKFTKGFGSVYGVINFASDILSYARLYGLMLSGAVIASIVSQYGGGFIVSGNIGLAGLGVLLLVVGHGFNLVMNLLGAYIHDARLQYVEFYGRFYEGDGRLFTPLGSQRKYVYLLPVKR